jgi:hypothetical protein
MTLMQIVHDGSEQQIDQAREVLDDARKALYRILAGEGASEGDEPSGEA